jgi:hypothetical protein
MPCFYPLPAYRQPSGQVTFHDKGEGRPLSIPCGQCVGCRLRRSSEWATRIVHETQLHEQNCFITLTYAPEYLPPDTGLRKKDHQDFMKRLRHEYQAPIRYFHTGEYGEGGRPHYHDILFGIDFHDRIQIGETKSKLPLYTSPTLERIWGQGFVSVDDVTYESAAYVARYCMKKVTGKAQDVIDEETGLKPYERFNSFTGEIVPVTPEYSTMSRRPGIGRSWFDAYSRDFYPKDYAHINDRRVKPPRFYDKLLSKTDPDLWAGIKEKREVLAYLSEDNTPERLAVREKVKTAQLNLKTRSLI